MMPDGLVWWHGEICTWSQDSAANRSIDGAVIQVTMDSQQPPFSHLLGCIGRSTGATFPQFKTLVTTQGWPMKLLNSLICSPMTLRQLDNRPRGHSQY